MYENGLYLLKGTYRYVGQIQKGSFGRVTLAVNVNTNTKVAMKAMYKAKEVAPIARHEIRVLRKLGQTNDHICQLLDHFETDEYIVMVLEYCANGDMYDIIHQDRRSGPRAVDVWNLAKELSLGLSYAHLLGIYHRDIKPENILFTETGRVKICDWGLATYTRYTSDFNVGTEKYMAPECFLNSPVSISTAIETYDCKYADYWSVGVTLLTAVFGTSPFKPVRGDKVWGSSDYFKRKDQTVEKSLESDFNFKNFVLYNKPEVLYDIYPTMNENCFKIFMNLLKVGDMEDDGESYTRKIQQRSLEKFMQDLENNWKFGLTVWEEEELYEKDEEEDEIAGNHDSVFDMDDFSEAGIADKKKHAEVSSICRDDDYDKDDKVEDYKGEQDGDRQLVPTKDSVSIPSLVGSSYQPKSWYDLEDNLDDEEFSKLFHSLSFRNVEPVTISAREDKGNRNIQIFEKELVEGLSWSDY